VSYTLYSFSAYILGLHVGTPSKWARPVTRCLMLLGRCCRCSYIGYTATQREINATSDNMTLWFAAARCHLSVAMCPARLIAYHCARSRSVIGWITLAPLALWALTRSFHTQPDTHYTTCHYSGLRLHGGGCSISHPSLNFLASGVHTSSIVGWLENKALHDNETSQASTGSWGL